MAESVIKRDKDVVRGITLPGSNITSDTIDSFTNTEIVQAFFTSGLPYTGVWGLLIVCNGRHDVIIEQVQICSKGISVRHRENDVWSEWKKVALS